MPIARSRIVHTVDAAPLYLYGINSKNQTVAVPGVGSPEGATYPVVNGGNTFTGTQTVTPVALTDAATIATDASLGNTFTVTLTANRMMGAPTNLVNGAIYNWHITQDATGSRTLAWDAIFKFAGGTAPTLTTTANKTDMIAGQYLSGPNVIRMGTLLKGYD